MKAVSINAWEIENNDGETLVFMTPEQFDFIQKYKENGNKEKVIIAQDNIIKEVRELLNQEWYSVLRKETIRKVREILDEEGE